MAGLRAETITVPHHIIPPGSNFALDIGGSLAKVAYVPREHKRVKGKDTPLYLMTFESDNLDSCLSYIKQHVIGSTNHIHHTVKATGVGCLKFQQQICDSLSIQLQVDSNEMQYQARGVDVLWRLLPPDKLLHSGSVVKDYNFLCPLVESALLPCLLVNLGSAMTIIQINADGTTSSIIGGSCQGGLTLLGLGALLTSAKSFTELVELAERGDRRNVDLLVKDIAGTAYNAGVDDMVSSFGKAAKLKATNPNSHFREEDIAHSLLYLVTDQLAQTAYLVARSQGIHRLVFCGSYLAANQTIIQQITAKLGRASTYLQHEAFPVFVRYEGYLGAIGLLFSEHGLPPNIVTKTTDSPSNFGSLSESLDQNIEGRSESLNQGSHIEGHSESHNQGSHDDGRSESLNQGSHIDGRSESLNQGSHIDGHSESLNQGSHIECRSESLNQGSHIEGHSQTFNQGSHNDGHSESFNKGSHDDGHSESFNKGSHNDGHSETFNQGSHNDGHSESFNKGSHNDGCSESHNKGLQIEGHSESLTQGSHNEPMNQIPESHGLLTNWSLPSGMDT